MREEDFVKGVFEAQTVRPPCARTDALSSQDKRLSRLERELREEDAPTPAGDFARADLPRACPRPLGSGRCGS